MITSQILYQRFYRILFLLLMCYFSFFVNNRLIYADIMESRNLVTAREIVTDGNWIIPTMNGELRLEKPPLPTWIAAGVELVSPDNLVLQRAMAGLAATMLVFFLYGLATLFTRDHWFALMSAVLLCTSFNIILMGRTATWDIYCHAFMLGAIYYFFKGGQKEGSCWKEFLLAGFFLGLSFLGKGPVSFYALLLPFLLAYFIVFRPSFRGKGWPVICMVLICLVISLWWPVLLYVNHREIALSVWNKESTAWLERSVRPWYYYWKFFAESGIWALFLVTALIWPYWKKRVQWKKEYLFSVCWVFLILICLSLLPEKKTRYLLPILIPSALVIAFLFRYWFALKNELPRQEKWIIRINTCVIAGLVSLLPIGIGIFFLNSLGIGFFIFITIVLEAIALWLFRAALKERAFAFLGGILMLFFIVEVFLLPAVVGLFNNPELNSIHAVRNIPELKDIPFYYDKKDELRIEIVYEAGRKILPRSFQEGTDMPELPFALVSQEKAEEVLPESWLEKVQLKVIGIYDDNKRLAGSSLHSPKFVHQVTLITPREN